MAEESSRRGHSILLIGLAEEKLGKSLVEFPKVAFEEFYPARLRTGPYYTAKCAHRICCLQIVGEACDGKQAIEERNHHQVATALKRKLER